MQRIPENAILKFHPDTMEYLRKKYNLDRPGEMDQAIDILEQWVKKQNHFMKKDFPRERLERHIIQLKGSVERAKLQLDKICTFRTLMPRFFEKYDAKNDLRLLNGYTSQCLLPNLTHDHYRVYISHFAKDGAHSAEMYFLSYVYGVLLSEYIKTHDYCDGFIAVTDLRDVNIVDFVTEININEMRQIATIAIEGYCARLKGIHVLSTSKAIDMLVKIFKSMVSKKIGDRIQVHKTVEELYEYIPKEMMPADYGGKEKTLKELHDDTFEALSAEENLKHLKEMQKAGTDESLRPTATFNENYLGMAGTFRTLNVD